MNRITAAVKKMEEILPTLAEEQITVLTAAADLSPSEWAFFGDKPSLALAEGKINQDEAVELHRIHTEFHKTATLAERMTFMRVMAELR